MIRSERKGMKLLRSYFLTYAAVLLIPVIAAVISQLEAVKTVQTDIEYENQALLDQAASILDIQMLELKDIGTQMANNTVLSTLRSLEQPLEYPNIQALLRMQNELPSRNTLDTFLYDYFFFFNKGQLALNDRSVYSYDDFYALHMRTPGQSLEDWKHEVTSVPLSNNRCSVQNVTILDRDRPEEKTLIEITFSFLPYSSHDGQVVLYLDQQNLLDILDGFHLRDEDVAYIESQDGILLACASSDPQAASLLQSALQDQSGNANLIRTRIGRKDMLASRLQSDQTGLTIAIARSESQVYARLHNIHLIVGSSLIFALMLGGLFSYLFSRQNSSFLRKLADDTHTQHLNRMSYTEAFQSLRNKFEDIQNANDSMEKTLASQELYLRRSYMAQLLNGDFSNEEKALAVARSIPSLRLETPMRVLLLHFSSDNALSGDATELQLSVNCTAVIRLSIESLEPDALRSSRSDSDYVILLCGSNLSERIEKLVQLIRSNLPEDINACLFAYAGTPVERLTDVVRSWESACSMIYIQPSPDEVPVQYFRENENSRFEVFYPQDLQKRLINCVMNHDRSGMDDILNTLKEKNSRGTEMPSYISHLLVDSLISTLLQINTLSGLPSEQAQEIHSKVTELMSMPIHQRFETIRSLYASVSDAIERNKSDSGKAQTIDDIAAYIEEHFADPDLSLTGVADLFHVSESYLSFTFKAQKGINFFSYIEDMRISKAKALLRQTSLKISEIAEQSGYASTNSFCRAFKRKTGISASSYRNGTDE